MKSKLVLVSMLLLFSCAVNETAPSFNVPTSDVPSINNQTTFIKGKIYGKENK